MYPGKGFYSAVESKKDPQVLEIRARVRADLNRLKADHIPDLRIIKGGGTDYQLRGFTTRPKWAKAVAAMAIDIDYTNFKDAVTARQGHRRHDVYMRVWSALWGLVEPKPRKRQQRFTYADEDEAARWAL
jgi:hypothetical protein